MCTWNTLVPPTAGMLLSMAQSGQSCALVSLLDMAHPLVGCFLFCPPGQTTGDIPASPSDFCRLLTTMTAECEVQLPRPGNLGFFKVQSTLGQNGEGGLTLKVTHAKQDERCQEHARALVPLLDHVCIVRTTEVCLKPGVLCSCVCSPAAQPCSMQMGSSTASLSVQLQPCC